MGRRNTRLGLPWSRGPTLPRAGAGASRQQRGAVNPRPLPRNIFISCRREDSADITHFKFKPSSRVRDVLVAALQRIGKA
jgi:hypothetical protein